MHTDVPASQIRSAYERHGTINSDLCRLAWLAQMANYGILCVADLNANTNPARNDRLRHRLRCAISEFSTIYG